MTDSQMEKCVEGKVNSTWENMHVRRGRKKLASGSDWMCFEFSKWEIMEDRLVMKAGLNIEVYR